jgi:hypothetical protein
MAKNTFIYNPDGGLTETDSYLRYPWSTKQGFMLASKLDTKFLESVSTLFLLNLNTNDYIDLKLVPDKLAESYSQKIISESPFGVMNPVNFYVGGDPKKISFSFNIHEDYNGFPESLYQFIEKIQKMSEPVISDGVVLPPLVYFQLGDQFAGKGHIITAFEYEKPFSQGRYKYASCSLSFIFHEVFKTDMIGQIDVTETTVSGYSLDLSSSEYAGMSIEDFYSQKLDYDYIINDYLFSDAKLGTLLNLIYSQPIQKAGGANELSSIDELQYLLTGNYSALGITEDEIKVRLSQVLNFAGNAQGPFFEYLLGYYVDFFSIIQNIAIADYASIISNLTRLSTRVTSLKAYFDSCRITGYYEGASIILYAYSEAGLSPIYVNLSLSDVDTFNSALNALKEIIIDQINVYTFLSGGTG